MWWSTWATHALRADESFIRHEYLVLANDSFKMTLAFGFWCNRHDPKAEVRWVGGVSLRLADFEKELRKKGAQWGKDVVVKSITGDDNRAFVKVIVASYLSEAVELIVRAPPQAAGVTLRQLATSIVDMYGVIYASEAEWLSKQLGFQVDGQTMNLQAQFLKGPYGLWGHGIGDLNMCGFRYVPELKAYLPMIDS